MPYMLNGNEVQLSEEPIQKDGRHYVPLKEVTEKLGGKVDWNNHTKTASATIGQWTAMIENGSSTVNVNGQKILISQPPYVENDKMYVPWDFFHDAYGYKADMEEGVLSVRL